MQLIDKAAVIAKIDSLISNLRYTEDDQALQIDILSEVEKFVNTLEVKEVDLEKEIKLYQMRNPIIGHREESLNNYMSNVAKHFFELGLKVQKEE